MDVLTFARGDDESALVDDGQALGARIACGLSVTLQVSVIVEFVSNKSPLKSGPPHKILQAVNHK